MTHTKRNQLPTPRGHKSLGRGWKVMLINGRRTWVSPEQQAKMARKAAKIAVDSNET